MVFASERETQLIFRTTIALNLAVLVVTPSMAAAAQDEVGLGQFYLGQSMQACPDNRPPVTMPGFPPTTCDVNSIQTLVGQPVSSFVVAFGEGRVFLIMAKLPAGEGTRLKVRDALAERYGRPEGPQEKDGYVGYFWKLSRERLIVVEGDSTRTLVQVFDTAAFKLQAKKQSAAPKLPAFEVVVQAPPLVMVVVPKATTDEELKAFVYALRDARREDSLTKLIPAVASGRVQGKDSKVHVMVFDDRKYASPQSLQRWLDADKSDPFVKEYNARLRAQYVYDAVTTKEHGEVASPNGALKLY